MSKKAVLGGVAAAIVVAYGASTWYAGKQIQSSYETAFGELPKQTAFVRVIERSYERGFLGATNTVTLELGCAADAAAPAVAEPVEPKDEDDEEETPAEATPPKPVRITLHDTIHHGPFAGGLAAATIDSALVLDPASQAEAQKIFGTPTPLTAHTKVGFDGGFATDFKAAAGKFAQDGKGELAWQGATARLQLNGARDRVHSEFDMPGIAFNDAAQGLTMKLGKVSGKADMDRGLSWLLATGKAEGRLGSFEFAALKGLGPVDPDEPNAVRKPLPTMQIQNVELVSEATVQDGLYASTGTLKGKGKIGAADIDRFEMTSSAQRIQATGYKKLADAWLLSTAAAGCGKGGGKASQVAMQALADQLAPDLKAMAKFNPSFGLDKFVVEIDGKRGEVSYSAGLVGVTDEDAQGPGPAMLMKRGVLKANARLPVKWLEKMAETGSESGQTPPPEMLAGLLEQFEEKGFVKREGDDVTSTVEFSQGALKVNGKPLPAR